MDLQFVVRIANRKLADNADVPDALAFKGCGNASDLFFMDRRNFTAPMVDRSGYRKIM